MALLLRKKQKHFEGLHPLQNSHGVQIQESEGKPVPFQLHVAVSTFTCCYLWRQMILSKTVTAPFITASCASGSFTSAWSAVGPSTWRQNVFWRWFRQEAGWDGFTWIWGLAFPSFLLLSCGPCSSSHQAVYLPSSSCTQVGALHLSGPIQVPPPLWSFTGLCQPRLYPSCGLFTLPLRSMHRHTVSSLRN